MQEIEFDPPDHSACECCGRRITRLTRFVYQDDGPYAVYYAQFTEHDPSDVFVMVGLGEWGDDDVDPVQARTAFAFSSGSPTARTILP